MFLNQLNVTTHSILTFCLSAAHTWQDQLEVYYSSSLVLLCEVERNHIVKPRIHPYDIYVDYLQEDQIRVMYIFVLLSPALMISF